MRELGEMKAVGFFPLPLRERVAALRGRERGLRPNPVR